MNHPLLSNSVYSPFTDFMGPHFRNSWKPTVNNFQSMSKHQLYFADMLCILSPFSHSLDLLALTNTWFSCNDTDSPTVVFFLSHALLPMGFSLGQVSPCSSLCFPDHSPCGRSSFSQWLLKNLLWHLFLNLLFVVRTLKFYSLCKAVARDSVIHYRH